MAAFALLALHLGRIRDLSPTVGRRIIAGLAELPGQVTGILERADPIADVAKEIAFRNSVLFVGHRRGWPVAREGAQNHLRSTLGEEAWLTGMNPDIPETKLLDNPYRYTDYRSAATHEA